MESQQTTSPPSAEIQARNWPWLFKFIIGFSMALNVYLLKRNADLTTQIVNDAKEHAKQQIEAEAKRADNAEKRSDAWERASLYTDKLTRAAYNDSSILADSPARPK